MGAKSSTATTIMGPQQSFSEHISHHFTHLAPKDDILNPDDVAYLEDIGTQCVESYPCQGHTIKIHYKNGTNKIFEHNGDIIYLLYDYCGKEIPIHYKIYKNYVSKNP